MSIKTKIAAIAIAAAALTGGLASTAEAGPYWHPHHHWGPAVGFGLVAGTLAGAAIANSYAQPVVYGVRCRLVRQYDEFGNYLGRTRVCAY